MPSNITTLLLIPLMLVAFYFLLIRPQRKRQQDQQRLLSELEPGSRVLTTTGIFGTLVEINDKQAVLEVCPGVQITMLRQAIARIAKPEDEGDPAQADLPDSTVPDSTVPAGTVEDGTLPPTSPAAATAPDFDSYPAAEPTAPPAQPPAASGGVRDVTDRYFSRPNSLTESSLGSGHESSTSATPSDPTEETPASKDA
ncbi:MAG: preprotein translocase subunit YajC [Propionibacteriaceae bacterium]